MPTQPGSPTPPPRELAICNRCLVIVNASTSVYDEDADEYAPHPTSPVALRNWAASRVGHRLSIDDMPQAFHSVSTWHGDPVCPYHLMERVQAERMGR